MDDIKLPCLNDLAQASKQLFEEGRVDVSSITHFEVEDVILSGELYLSRKGEVDRMENIQISFQGMHFLALKGTETLSTLG